MKKLLLLLLLSANVQMAIKDSHVEICAVSTARAQHMYREAGDNCKKNNLWYQVTDLCDGTEQSSLRCSYCGLYFTTVTIRNTHQKTCKYRPHIEYEYDEAGNRTEREIVNYRLGRRVTACNDDIPRREGMDWAMRPDPISFAIKSEERDLKAKRRENVA